MPTSPHQCPNCPAGYNCETGDYSFDDFEEIRDEQKARLATGGIVHGPIHLPTSGCVIDARPAHPEDPVTTTEQQARMIGKAIREEAEIVPTPLANATERRAFSLKMAIETRGSAFPVKSSATEDAADVLTAARMYDAFLSGAETAAAGIQGEPLPDTLAEEA